MMLIPTVFFHFEVNKTIYKIASLTILDGREPYKLQPDGWCPNATGHNLCDLSCKLDSGLGGGCYGLRKSVSTACCPINVCWVVHRVPFSCPLITRLSSVFHRHIFDFYCRVL